MPFTHFAKPAGIENFGRSWPDKRITSSPRWCAVDLRDGNQALPHPMTPAQKLEYFRLLTRLGFKEIEIGFPAASQDDWDFCRRLIETDAIPDDVTISVLTQARPHIIRRTLEALKGIRHAICHLYIGTSDLFMKFVLKQSRDEIRAKVLDSLKQIKALSAEIGVPVGLEFSPEEFTDSDPEFTSSLCNTVVDAWFTGGAPTDEPVILNLPSTVERALPMHYADMIEWFILHNAHSDRTVISLHAHNDMGCAVADTELALLAGGQRVEGTLFGNGERSGNVDLVTLALNLQYLGIDTGLDFSQLETVADRISLLTGIPVHMRQPYAGELTFTAFAGSHQDAINKGFEQINVLTKHFHGWKIPYLHIDPAMVGRQFKEYIRITSQSGKGAIAHVLKNSYGVELPQGLLIDLAKCFQKYVDREEREYAPEELWDFFKQEYMRLDAPLKLQNYWPRPDKNDPNVVHAEVHVLFRGESHVLQAEGNGPVAAFAAALRQLPLPQFLLIEYEERAIGTSVNAESITIVQLRKLDGEYYYGIGFGENIVQGAARAVISGLNRMQISLQYNILY